MATVAVIVGSLRRGSINRQLALALRKLAAPKLELNLLKIDDLPLYNEDLWESPPVAVTRLKSDVAAADAVLFVTPENNRSFTSVIKNVVDWGSRPYGKNSWGGKPTAIVGATPGGVGTAVAQQQLRAIMVILGSILMGQPEAYITFEEGLIDADHNVTDDSKRQSLQTYVDKFADWIARHGG